MDLGCSLSGESNTFITMWYPTFIWSHLIIIWTGAQCSAYMIVGACSGLLTQHALFSVVVTPQLDSHPRPCSPVYPQVSNHLTAQAQALFLQWYANLQRVDSPTPVTCPLTHLVTVLQGTLLFSATIVNLNHLYSTLPLSIPSQRINCASLPQTSACMQP